MVIGELIGSVIEALGLNYFYGSPLIVSNVYAKTKPQSARMPAGILFDDFSETIGNWDEVVGRSANITVYFMTAAFKNWTEQEHIDNAISPMIDYADAFTDYIDSDKRFDRIDDAAMQLHSDWGLTLTAGNSTQSVFPDFLSGVELTFTLKVKRKYC